MYPTVFLLDLETQRGCGVVIIEGVEKHWLTGYTKFFKIKIFNLPSPCPLPAPNPVSFLALICWERVVLLQVGAAVRPHLQAFFPSPASVSQVKSETSRWGGESKGWGVQCRDCRLRLCLEIVIN